jgi:hypothetical protein
MVAMVSKHLKYFMSSLDFMVVDRVDKPSKNHVGMEHPWNKEKMGLFYALITFDVGGNDMESFFSLGMALRK